MRSGFFSKKQPIRSRAPTTHLESQMCPTKADKEAYVCE